MFTDIKTFGSYVDSEQARKAISSLRAEFGLSFTQNPGGGEFYRSGWGRCQISMCDDVADYEHLKQWVISRFQGG